MEKEMRINETYSFTDQELSRFSKAFETHLKTCGDDGNSGRHKMPKHWMKFVIYTPPRSGFLHKGIECPCGWSCSCLYDKED